MIIIVIIINSINLLILEVLLFHHLDPIIDFRVHFIIQDCPATSLSHIPQTTPYLDALCDLFICFHNFHFQLSLLIRSSDGSESICKNTRATL